MDLSGVVERVEHVARTRAAAATTADAGDTALALQLARAGMVAIRETRAWLAAAEAELTRVVRRVDAFPEQTIAADTKGSMGAAGALLDTAGVLDDAPAVADALDDAVITDEYVTIVTRASRSVPARLRSEFLRECEALMPTAASMTRTQFRRRVREICNRLLAHDGLERLERQRRATSLRSWTDDDGMLNLKGRFDPVTGAHLHAVLEHTVQQLFAETVPTTCPEHPIEKQAHLRALALVRLVTGGGLVDAGETRNDADARPMPVPSGGRVGTDLLVVIDATQTNGAGGPLVDWGIPVEVPVEVLADLIGDAESNVDLDIVVVRNGIVLHAPGKLDLGRSSRLANRAQRRALRALYATCAIPNCHVHVNRCKFHHIVWWEHGGQTDLHNLLPVCANHHARIHADNWNITLGPHRELTITLPDNTVMATGPPARQAA
ncbi:MAG: DUF222 domain-containing protein [Ilumatobacter sp.]|uniref:HNH endonuclease signature motif containing protein n=1 Tax=Ilumatobacter sp. TaxID=1967498 RepID=UPI00391B2EBA